MVYWCASTAQSFFAFLYEKKSSQNKRAMVKCFFAKQSRTERFVSFGSTLFFFVKKRWTFLLCYCLPLANSAFILFAKKKGS